MRVVIVNRGMGIFRGGGEVYDLRLAEHLMTLGVTVEFVAGLSLQGSPKIPEPPGPTTYVRSPYLRAFAQSLPRYLRPGVSATDWWLFEQGAFRTIRGRQADVVQLNALPVLAGRIRRRLGVPTVLVFHGVPRRVFAPLIRRASAVVSYGDALRQLRAIQPDAADIPPGVDAVIPASRRDIRQELGVPHDAFVALFAGRLVPIKNLPLLLEGFSRAAVRIPSLHLLICGEGQVRASLERRANALGLGGRVHWGGYVPHQDLIHYYGAADAFVITSSYDNFPFVVLEAMAAGLPVVGTRVGGIPLQVEEGMTGLLVRPGDADDLAQALVTLAGDPEKARRMGDIARERVGRLFSWSASARKLYAVYQRVAGVAG